MNFAVLSVTLHNLILCISGITSELRGKWQDNRRSSMAKEDINVFRWDQLKHLLQSGKQKVLLSFMIEFCHGNAEVVANTLSLARDPFLVFNLDSWKVTCLLGTENHVSGARH